MFVIAFQAQFESLYFSSSLFLWFMKGKMQANVIIVKALQAQFESLYFNSS